MTRLLLRRLADMMIVLVLASAFIFALLRLVPGDPAVAIAGPNASLQQLAAIRKTFGLDKPLPVQYAIWVDHVVHGDLGTSYLAGQSVSTEIMQRFPVTAELAVGAMLIALALGIPLGLLAGLRQNRMADGIVSSFNTLWLSIPTFWSGLIFLLIFGLKLGVVPVAGSVPFTQHPLDAARHLILPWFTLGLAIAPEFAWFVRNGVLDVAGRDYVRTARAKGLPRPLILRRHVIRNALLPLITIVGINFGRVLGGAVVVEAVFNLPGIGGLTINALEARDYPTVQGVILFVVVIFIAVNFLTDLTYMWADPRVKVS